MPEAPKSNMTPNERLFNNFVDALNDCVKPEADGSPAKPGAPILNVIRQFLKDQNISADPATHNGLQDLSKNSKKLPFAEAPGDDE